MIPIIYVPFIQNIFGTDSLSLLDWGQVIVISTFGLIAVEFWELVNRKYFHYGVTA
jgi:hypothetical protein